MKAKIKVHEKALAHLSRGLYRSPASALRELVSNAWDASASSVYIGTNYPNFLQLSVQDDGIGFTGAEFSALMDGGVGNSQKRPSQIQPKNERPVIGRLGIGMLGIAQICGAFTISSTPSHGKGFKARVRLYDLLKEGLDRNEPNLVKDSEEGIEVDVGEYELLPHTPSQRPGTSIIADDIHPTFSRSFQESLKYPQYEEPALRWAEALKTVNHVHSLQQLGDYWRLLWELAVSCPIPYISDRALPERSIAGDQKKLLAYDFKVVVDNIELAKPVFLDNNAGGYTVHRIKPVHQRVYGKDLRFHGYIVVQEGAQLKPDELRGILIRIKNVAVGYYDPSMLDYRFNEGPRSRWLTGEIFVDEGLEDALNIDRDSFNRFHPQFRALQVSVHDVLRNEVFPNVYRNIKVRSTSKQAKRKEKRTNALSAVLSEATGKDVSIYETAEPGDVRVDEGTRTVDITVPAANTIDTRKPNRELAAAVMALFEIALRERGKDAQREMFVTLLLELLAEW